MAVRVYWASVTGNRKVNGDQTRLRYLIESYKIDSTWIDITTSRDVCNRMRKECSNPKALPPQIFNGDAYLGNVEDMNESIEDGRLMEWLRIDSPKPANKENEESTAKKEDSSEQSSVASTDVDVPKSSNVETLVEYEESKESSSVAVSTKSVSSAVNVFENLRKSPKISHKTVTLQFANNNTNNNSNEMTKIDEERKRRILGLSQEGKNDPVEIKCLQDKTNDNASATNGVKAVDADVKEIKIFQGQKINPLTTNNQLDAPIE